MKQTIKKFITGMTFTWIFLATMGVSTAYPQQLQLDISLSSVDVIRFTDLAKFDPNSSGGTSRVLFKFTATNTGSVPYNIKRKDAKLTMLYNGKSLDLAIFNGSDVVVEPGRSVVVDNTNAFKPDSRFNWEREGDFSIDKIKEILFGSKNAEINLGGPLPAGEYTFAVSVVGQGSVSQSLVLSNPSGFVQIVGPGAELNSGDVPTIFNKQPFIAWIGDAPSYRLRVYEKGTNDKSISDFKSKVANLDIDNYKSTSFQYPASGVGVRPLEVGKTYVIIVESKLNSLGSNVAELNVATPYEFKLAELQSASEGASSQALELLKQLFGDSNEAVFAALKDAKPDGNATVDGRPIGVQELIKIGNNLRSGQFKLVKVSVK